MQQRVHSVWASGMIPSSDRIAKRCSSESYEESITIEKTNGSIYIYI